MRKEVKDIVWEMQQKGWAVVSGKTKHIKLRHPDYGTQTVPRSPSDHHWKQNLLKQIAKKERGLNV